MTTNDILKLVNAGFTKEEIFAISSNETKSTVEKPVTTDDIKNADNSKVTESPKDEPKTETTPTTVTNPLMTDAQIEKLAQLLNANSASIDVPPKTNISDTLAEHFKDLMLGKD